MPEIWLGYGETEVILDIKYENILKIANPNLEKMTDERIQTTISKDIEIQESTLIMFVTPFRFMSSLIKIFHNKLIEEKVSSWEICIVSTPFSHRTRQLLSEYNVNFTRISTNQIIDKISSFKNVILIDKMEFDPIFGYAGTYSRLVRHCYPEIMNQIYPTILNQIPRPGELTEALKIAVEHITKRNYQMINVISDSVGIDSIYIGNSSQLFFQTASLFKQKSTVESSQSKSGIFSGFTNFNLQKTLSDSLNLLWNNIQSVSQNGTIILLSENRDGIGHGAISKYIEGRLDFDGLNKYNYIKDIEHLNFLQACKENYDIILISTLPKLYLEKLGIKSMQKIKDGLDYLLKNNGKYHKINIIPTSEITFVSKI